MQRRHVLLVGDASAPEFRAAWEWLQAHTVLQQVDSVPAAVRWLLQGGAELCSAIVLPQLRRGLLSNQDVERLHGAAPLARLISLLGSWCEGDQRSGPLPGGTTRVYWHQFCARADREWRTPDGEGMLWNLPRTAANDNDQLLQLHTAHDTIRPTFAGVIAIHAESLVAYECLAEICQLDGWSTIWLAPRQLVRMQRPALLLWDAAGESDELIEFRYYVDQLQATTSIVLLGFARYEDHCHYQAAGATAVVSKPFLTSDLLQVLRSAVPAAQRRLAG